MAQNDGGPLSLRQARYGRLHRPDILQARQPRNRQRLRIDEIILKGLDIYRRTPLAQPVDAKPIGDPMSPGRDPTVGPPSHRLLP